MASQGFGESRCGIAGFGIMTVTSIQLAGAIRVGDGVAEPVEPELSIVRRVLGIAQEMIESRAPDAPEPVKDEATVRLAAYLYDFPPAPRGGDMYANVFVNSGAGSLLSRWSVQRAAYAVLSE